MITIYEFTQHENAPTFIYKIAHDKNPDTFISGRINHPKKYINGIDIDKYIPTNSIKKLNNIPEIEMRSSCQGESSDRPAFIIFRLVDKNINLNRFIKNLNTFEDIKVGHGVGNGGFVRIGITNPDVYYGIDLNIYNKWWNELPIKIIKSL